MKALRGLTILASMLFLTTVIFWGLATMIGLGASHSSRVIGMAIIVGTFAGLVWIIEHCPPIDRWYTGREQ